MLTNGSSILFCFSHMLRETEAGKSMCFDCFLGYSEHILKNWGMIASFLAITFTSLARPLQTLALDQTKLHFLALTCTYTYSWHPLLKVLHKVHVREYSILVLLFLCNVLICCTEFSVSKSSDGCIYKELFSCSHWSLTFQKNTVLSLRLPGPLAFRVA